MHQTQTISFLVLIILLGLQSCKSKNDEIIEGLNIPAEMLNESDSLRDVREFNNLIYTISTLPRIEGPVIGLEGRKSTQPNYVRMLAACVDTTRLIKLTDHGSAIVKLFAFQALSEKKYIRLKEILGKHLFDEQTYEYIGGCVSESIPINVAYFRCIFPTLTKEEADFYRGEILKKDKGYHNVFEPSGL